MVRWPVADLHSAVSACGCQTRKTNRASDRCHCIDGEGMDSPHVRHTCRELRLPAFVLEVNLSSSRHY